MHFLLKVVSGAVPVPVSKSAWSVHNRSTNTYKLDLRRHWHQLPARTFGLRVAPPAPPAATGTPVGVGAAVVVGIRRGIRAKYPNGNPETSAAHCPRPLAQPWGPCNYSSVFDDTMLKYVLVRRETLPTENLLEDTNGLRRRPLGAVSCSAFAFC